MQRVVPRLADLVLDDDDHLGDARDLVADPLDLQQCAVVRRKLQREAAPLLSGQRRFSPPAGSEFGVPFSLFNENVLFETFLVN